MVWKLMEKHMDLTHHRIILYQILKIKETETSYGYVLDDRRYIIDTKEKKSTHYPVDNPERKYVNRCIKLDLPKGVKINY